MTLKLNGSSSGSVSIDAPASTTGGADVTLTLPENGFGKILQVVTATSNSANQEPSGNQTWTDVTPTGTITPNSTSSKIIIVSSVQCICKETFYTGFKLFRGSTGIREWWTYASDSSNWEGINGPTMHIDSPSTTSATTYKFQIYAHGNYSNFNYNYTADSVDDDSLRNAEMYLLEIGP